MELTTRVPLDKFPPVAKLAKIPVCTINGYRINSRDKTCGLRFKPTQYGWSPFVESYLASLGETTSLPLMFVARNPFYNVIPNVHIP